MLIYFCKDSTYNPFRHNLFFTEVTIFSMVQMSTFIWKLLSYHRSINYVGSLYESECKFVLHVKDLWSCRLWCYVYKSGNGNDSDSERYKQTQHTTAKMSLFIWAPGFFLHLMESEKQYHMCQEIWQTAANETWHKREPQFCNEAIRNDWVECCWAWINIRGQADLVNTQLLTFIEMHWMVVCIEVRILRWLLSQTWMTKNKFSLFSHPWYFFHVLCMYMFNLIAETD